MNLPRVIANIVIKNGLHVQSIGFEKYLPLGCPIESAREFDRWGIDEIIITFLDGDYKASLNLISKISEAIAVPLTATGGIRKITEAKEYISVGADKIGINNTLQENKRLVSDIANILGNQCVVASIDIIRNKKEIYPYSYKDKKTYKTNIFSWIDEVEKMGAGEILLNFPERDGMGKGMDVDAVTRVVNYTPLPVIAIGGIGRPLDAVKVYKIANPSGIGIANRLAFFEHTVLLFKQALKDSGAPIRIGVKANYSCSSFDKSGLPKKKSEKKLYELFFEQIEAEVI